MNHDLEHQSNKIRTWMQHLLATGGIERFDDLHIDEIDEGWVDRNQWIRGMKESLEAARPIRSTTAPDKVLALVCSLEDGPCESPSNFEKLAAQFDWSPPSLYLFHSGMEPWKNLDSKSKFTRLPLDGFQGLDVSELFLQEWTIDGALRRSLFGIL